MKFERSIELPVSNVDAFAWHERPGAFARLRPPWQTTRLLSHEGGIRDGARVTVQTQMGPIKSDWEIEHHDYEPGRLFTDTLLKGPFESWVHRHEFEPINAKLSTLVDKLDISAPLGALGKLGEPFLSDLLNRVFSYRHQLTREDLRRQHDFGPPLTERTVLIVGVTGTVGQQLAAFFQTRGYRVAGLSRSGQTPWPGLDVYSWDPGSGAMDADLPTDIAVVINLSGESIIGRWTPSKRERILQSRLLPIQALHGVFQERGIRPELWLNASGTGYYGPQVAGELDESSPLGRGFLAEVCRDWESAVLQADLAERSIAGRFGVVLSATGGALAQMLPAFSMGLGGPLGTPHASMAWIHIQDLVYAIEHCLRDPAVSGAVNFTAPESVKQRDFARALGRAVKRPAVLPVPGFPLKWAFGQMADETLLSDQRVRPAILHSSGFRWSFPDIQTALKFELGRG